MRLIDLLGKLGYNTLVGIWNIDDAKAKQPTHQTYQKVGNIPWKKIRGIINFEVMCIIPVKENGGLLIKVHDKDRLRKSMDNYDLAEKIAKYLRMETKSCLT